MLYTIQVKRALYSNRYKTKSRLVEKAVQLSFVPFPGLGLPMIPDWDCMIVKNVYVERFSPGPEDIEIWVEACVEADEREMAEILKAHLDAGWVIDSEKEGE